MFIRFELLFVSIGWFTAVEKARFFTVVDSWHHRYTL